MTASDADRLADRIRSAASAGETVRFHVIPTRGGYQANRQLARSAATHYWHDDPMVAALVAVGAMTVLEGNARMTRKPDAMGSPEQAPSVERKPEPTLFGYDDEIEGLL